MAFQLLLRATVEACAAAGPPWLLEKRQFEWRTGEAGLEYLKPPPNDFLPKVAGLDANRLVRSSTHKSRRCAPTPNQ